MEKSSKIKQGFFFTILALIVVSFIFVSVQLWAQTVQVEEARAAERFKVEALRSTLELIDNESLNRFSKASMAYAMEKLAVELNAHEDKDVYGIAWNTTGLFPDGTGGVNLTIYELMAKGNTSAYLAQRASSSFKPTFYSNGTNLSYNSTEKKYMLNHYFNQTSAAAKILGYDLVWGNVSGFTFNQTSVWNVTLKYNVTVTLTDRNKLVSLKKLMSVNVTMDIQGFTDPYVGRMDRVYRPDPSINASMRPHRNIYHISNYTTPADAKARLIMSGVQAPEGMGWFFGPVTEKNSTYFNDSKDDPIYNISRIGQFIYMTSNPEDAVQQSAFFGGIILVSSPTENRRQYTQSGCDYVETNQTNCLYCIRRLERLPSLGCNARAEYNIIPESIPINRNIPYIMLTGAVDSSKFVSPPNYHYGLYEVLFTSMYNASSPRSQDLTVFRDHDPSTYVWDSDADLRRKSNGESRVWDMTGPRDMAICGFYVKSDFGPSYLQRFTEKPYTGYSPSIGYSSNPAFGIESFLTGRWAGGSDDPLPDWAKFQIGVQNDITNVREQRSRMDYQFYTYPNIAVNNLNDPLCEGAYFKGMPGCKSYPMCSNGDTSVEANSARVLATGRFALSNETAVEPNPAIRYNIAGLFTEFAALDSQACK